MAKPITISVPDELSAELKKFPEIKVSAICQAALKNQLEKLKSRINKDQDLVIYAEQRFKEELLKEISDWENVSEEAGAQWAAQEASLEDLRSTFESDYEGFDLVEEAFIDHGCIPDEIKDRFKEDTKILSDAFVRGAMNMFEQIKKRMKENGFSEFL